MKIGIDATALCRMHTGIETYALNLIKALLQPPQENEFIIFFRREIHPELRPLQQGNKFFVSPFKNQLLTEQIWLPYISRSLDLEIMHFPAFPPGFMNKTGYIMTCFDAVIWKYSQTLSWKGRFYWKPLTRLAFKKAAKVITISERSQEDIVAFSGISSSKIVNTGIGISARFKSVVDDSELANTRFKYNLPEKFILSVCSLEPRKNLEGLLSAFLKLKQNDSLLPHKLVLVGRAAWGNKKISSMIKKLGLDTMVCLLGYVPSNDLVLIYNLAEIFVFPSFYEGFGLPVMEAMACGLPTISSRVASLEEAAGNATEFIDPHNIDEIFTAMEMLLRDKYRQNQLRQLGYARAKKYLWNDIARKVRGVYYQ